MDPDPIKEWNLSEVRAIGISFDPSTWKVYDLLLVLDRWQALLTSLPGLNGTEYLIHDTEKGLSCFAMYCKICQCLGIRPNKNLDPRIESGDTRPDRQTIGKRITQEEVDIIIAVARKWAEALAPAEF